MVVRTKAGLFASPQEAITAQWEAKSSTVDWLGLERVLRELIAEGASVDELDEALAAFTRRGHSKAR